MRGNNQILREFSLARFVPMLSRQNMKKHLLIVDDDSSVRESLQRVLQDTGYDVTLAVDGEDGEAKLRAGKFDLLILDVNLPGRDGWDVLEFVSHSNPLLPVVMITGLIDQMETTIIPGVSAVLEKPLDVPTMLKRIEDVLNQTAEQRLEARKASAEMEPWVRVSGRTFFEPATERPIRFSTKPTKI